MSPNHPPAGPTEQEVLDHFDGLLPADAKLMRPPYTSIWALENGTLLWDWRNGFADLSQERKPAKSAEKYEARPYGVIAAQKESINRQAEEIASLKRQLSRVRLDLSMIKSNIE